MLNKIIGTIIFGIVLLSGSFLFTGVTLADASYNNKYECGEVWNRFNARESVSRNEFKACRSTIINFYKNEIKLEYQLYKENRNYCKDKYIEISYRRNATFVENRLCGKKFKEYQKEEIAYKERVLRARGVVYSK